MTAKHQPETRPPWATSEELAARLQISLRTLANWRDEGKIPFIRITARSFRYDIAEVERKLRQEVA